jgi:thiamine kinase-like enzyme
LLYRVDETFFRRTFTNAAAALREAGQQQSNTEYDRLAEQVENFSQNTLLYDLLTSLPVTLTHGDVHSGNFLQSPTGDVTLIDWGNARIAPAMLDVANMIKLDSADYQRYLTEWEAASGQAVDERQMRLNYHWATIMVNAQYLPYAASFLPVDTAQAMAHKIRDAMIEIGK